MVATSDSSLFHKNKQAHFKNKPKIGNLTDKQAQNAFGKKIQQNEKPGGKLNTRAGRKIRKTSPQ